MVRKSNYIAITADQCKPEGEREAGPCRVLSGHTATYNSAGHEFVRGKKNENVPQQSPSQLLKKCEVGTGIYAFSLPF